MGREGGPAGVRERVWRLAEENVSEWARRDPCAAALAGAGTLETLTDYGPDACAERGVLARRTHARAVALADAELVGHDDDVAAEARLMAEVCSVEADLYESGQMQRRLDLMTCPFSEIRQAVTGAAPRPQTAEDGRRSSTSGASDEGWERFERLLRAVPDAMASAEQCLAWSAARGDAPAIRQVQVVADQCERLGTSGHFAALVDAAPTAPGLRGALVTAAGGADEAYARAAAWLRTDLAPAASDVDAFGPDRYRLWARWYVGADLTVDDLTQAHDWAVEEFVRLERRADAAAARIDPHATRHEVLDRLFADPGMQVTGPEAVQAWLAQCGAQAQQACAHLFDIPPELSRLDWRIGATGGVFYHGPAADGSRPGAVTWAYSDDEPLLTWLARPTVVHEGVPGHHLQIGRNTLAGDRLNPFQRYRATIAGYSEGWGLYAESLMATLGFYPTPADELGYLQNQFLRTARVVVDIGAHLRLPVPATFGGDGTSRWDAHSMRGVLATRAGLRGSFLDHEVNRYLGRGGQAISYTLGERQWRAALHAATTAGPEALRAAHTTALDLGPTTFDHLTAVLHRGDPA